MVRGGMEGAREQLSRAALSLAMNEEGSGRDSAVGALKRWP